MEDPKKRLVPSVSSGELERRWRAAREMMQDRKIDFLLMRQDEEYYCGYVRWFTGITPRHSYPFNVIFPIDDEMTTISSSPPAAPGPPEWAVRGVKRRLGAPYCPSRGERAGRFLHADRPGLLVGGAHPGGEGSFRPCRGSPRINPQAAEAWSKPERCLGCQQ